MLNKFKKIFYFYVCIILLFNMSIFRIDTKALVTDISVYNPSMISELKKAVNDKYPSSIGMKYIIYCVNQHCDIRYSDSPILIKTQTYGYFVYPGNGYHAKMFVPSYDTWSIVKLGDVPDITQTGPDSFDINERYFIWGNYVINGQVVDNTETPQTDNSKYYCSYKLANGNVTDDSNVVLGHGGGGSTRGGGVGRYTNLENAVNSNEINESDIVEKIDVSSTSKYIMVCYDRVTSKWKPHGNITIENNTIINNNYVSSDNDSIDDKGNVIAPSEGSNIWDLLIEMVKGLADAIGKLITGFADIVDSLISGITDMIKMLFIPNDDFLSTNFSNLQNTLTEKFPVMNDFENIKNDLFGSISGGSQMNSRFGEVAPSYKITLPDILGGQEVEVFDFRFFDEYRGMLHAAILFFCWGTFFLRLPNKISRVLGGFHG